MNIRNDTAAIPVGKNCANWSCIDAAYSSTSPSPLSTPIVDTIPSFATNPEREDATACHVPNPSGLKIQAIAPPIEARKHDSLSTIPNVPFWIPNVPRNHITAQQMKRIVPAFLRNAHTLSHT